MQKNPRCWEDALSEARRALEQNTKTGHSSGRLLSLIGSDAIKRNTGGFEKNFVSLIEGIVQVGTNYSGTWTFGVRAVGGADLSEKELTTEHPIKKCKASFMQRHYLGPEPGHHCTEPTLSCKHILSRWTI